MCTFVGSKQWFPVDVLNQSTEIRSYLLTTMVLESWRPFEAGSQETSGETSDHI